MFIRQIETRNFMRDTYSPGILQLSMFNSTLSKSLHNMLLRSVKASAIFKATLTLLNRTPPRPADTPSAARPPAP